MKNKLFATTFVLALGIYSSTAFATMEAAWGEIGEESTLSSEQHIAIKKIDNQKCPENIVIMSKTGALNNHQLSHKDDKTVSDNGQDFCLYN